LPAASYVGKIDRIDKTSCRVRRLVEDGYEVLDVEMAALLTVVKEIADPRLPTLRGKQRARKADIEQWTPEHLDVENSSLGLEGSPTRVVKIFRPKLARECEKIPAADEEAVGKAVDRLVEFLQERDLV